MQKKKSKKKSKKTNPSRPVAHCHSPDPAPRRGGPRHYPSLPRGAVEHPPPHPPPSPSPLCAAIRGRGRNAASPNAYEAAPRVPTVWHPLGSLSDGMPQPRAQQWRQAWSLPAGCWWERWFCRNGLSNSCRWGPIVALPVGRFRDRQRSNLTCMRRGRIRWRRTAST